MFSAMPSLEFSQEAPFGKICKKNIFTCSHQLHKYNVVTSLYLTDMCRGRKYRDRSCNRAESCHWIVSDDSAAVEGGQGIYSNVTERAESITDDDKLVSYCVIVG